MFPSLPLLPCESPVSVKENSDRKNNCGDQYAGFAIDFKATITVIKSLDFLMFYQFFLSPQVKQSAIISKKDDIYDLPHELSNDLRLRILAN